MIKCKSDIIGVAIELVKSQQQPPMDDLPLILASKDLFLSLSTLKIKTLKQAKEHLQSNENPKVKAIVDIYHAIQRKVDDSFQTEDTLVDFDAVKMQFRNESPLNYYWNTQSIIEIIGQKGSGKTALALRLAVEFAEHSPRNAIKIINCGGGITAARLNSIKNTNYEYSDAFSIEDLQEMVTKLRKSQQVGLLILDGVVSLVLGAQSQRCGVGEWLSSLRQVGWTVVFTNLVQGKLEVEEKEVMNSMGYFPNLFGGIVDLRLRIDLDQTRDDGFTVRALKTLNNRPYLFRATMAEGGLSELTPEGSY